MTFIDEAHDKFLIMKIFTSDSFVKCVNEIITQPGHQRCVEKTVRESHMMSPEESCGAQQVVCVFWTRFDQITQKIRESLLFSLHVN